MKTFYFLSILAACLQGIQAQSIAEITAATPQCALLCLVPLLTPYPTALVSLEALSLTLCTNVTLQSTLSTCVQKGCIFKEQVEATEVLTELCAGFPKESRGSEIKIVTAILSGVTFPVVALKFYTRLSTSKRLWADDYAALIASVALIALAGLEFASSSMGLGNHYWNVSPEDGIVLHKMFYGSQVIYVLIQVTAKCSLLLLFLRVFTSRWFRIACYLCIGFLVTHGLAYILVCIFQCRPVPAVWDLRIEGKCVSLPTVAVSGAIFSIVEDLVILLLPIPEVRNLQMDRRKKWGLAFMFGIGSFACVTSMVRLKYVLQFSTSYDSTWAQTDIVKWSVIEEFVAVLCACLPSLRAFFTNAFKVATEQLSSDNRQKSTGLSDSSGKHPLQNLKAVKIPAQNKKNPFTESTAELSPISPQDWRSKEFGETMI